MILMNDFKAEPAAVRDAMSEAARRVFESGWYVLGNECKGFEQRWAEACGVAHCVGVGNGLDAIELVLRALDIGTGDEVVTTPMTAFATVLAVLRAGATPVLADIDPDTALMSRSSVERCLSPRTKAVLLVHLYGQIREMEAWSALCERAGVALIEDCAQSHLAQWNGRCAGSFGAAGAYSFYPTKNLGAIGDAGAVVSNRVELATRIAQLRNYGQSERYLHPEAGMNSRLDELQAALLSTRLDWLDGQTRRRRDIAAAYDAGLQSPHVRTMAPALQAESHVHHLYVVRTERREELQRHLSSHGVQSLIHYPVPVHRQKPCVDLIRDPLGLLNAETHARTCLSLPCHPYLSDADVRTVIDAVNAFGEPD